MAPARIVHLGLGSNLGDRAAHLRHALDRIAGLPQTRLLAVSDAVETDPVGPISQDRFLNAAAAIETDLGPREILTHLQAIERERGRDRSSGQRWGPRTLDIDMLLYAGLMIDEPGLTIPHPRMHERLFVLVPLAQIAADAVVPTLGRTVSSLLQDLEINGESR